jgi:NAD(P)-dependent dehydrogenase (short-subunit alcohol dehydrogenase family)
MAGILNSKVTLITGGGSGIGRASALAFERAGATVVVADYNAEGGERTVRMLKDAGGEAMFYPADVSNPEDIEALVNKIVETYGRLDCAFNNAGIEGDFAALSKCTIENWQRIISINLNGVFYCMKYEIAQMLRQGGGSIVNTSSVAGLVGAARAGAYSAAKHGVVGLTKTAALEYARKNIRVNAVCPGFVRTPMADRLIDRGTLGEKSMIASEPINRMGRPEEIAEAVVWLCSDAASFVTGVSMPVDGGLVAQ